MVRQRPTTKQQHELKAIFTLHQEGLRCFEQYNLEAAKDCFNNSFSSITRLLRETRNRDSFYYRGSPLVRESNDNPIYSTGTPHNKNALDVISTGEKKADSSSCSPVLTLETTSASTAANSMSSCCPNEDDLPLFPQALHLPKSVTINQFVFVTLYNLALSTHLAALSQAATSSKRDTLMKRAVEQWGLVYGLQWRQGLNLKACHGLAILLNLGHAKALTGNESGSKTCYQNILSAIHMLESRQHDIPNKAFFLYNAFRMLGGGDSAVPAAAA